MSTRVGISFGVILVAAIFYIVFMNVSLDICPRDHHEMYVNQSQMCDIKHGSDGQLYCEIIDGSVSGVINVRLDKETNNTLPTKAPSTLNSPWHSLLRKDPIKNVTLVNTHKIDDITISTEEQDFIPPQFRYLTKAVEASKINKEATMKFIKLPIINRFNITYKLSQDSRCERSKPRIIIVVHYS